MDKRSENQWASASKMFPSNQDMYSTGTPFGPYPGPSQRRRNRAEGKKFEKVMNKEAERGIENWPPSPPTE